MKYMRDFIVHAVLRGMFVVVPAYLAFLLLLKGIQSAAGLVRPVAARASAVFPAHPEPEGGLA